MPLVSALFFFPLIGFLILLFMRNVSPMSIKVFSSLFGTIPLLLLLLQGQQAVGSSFQKMWIEPLHVQFALTITPLSLLFLYVVAALVPLAMIATRVQELPRAHVFYSLILLLQALVTGVFTADDLLLFTFFFEGMILPVYFLITCWGRPGSERASLQFMIYMIAGSALMIGAVLALHFSLISSSAQASFALSDLARSSEKAPYSTLLFFLFLFAFAVKTPLFPFHAWLPDAYCKGPIAATLLLAALLSKTGIFAIARISYGLFPNIFLSWAPSLLTLALLGALYSALIAWSQTDFKRLLAYSSFSHIQFLLIGLFMYEDIGRQGAFLQVINHSVTIAGLFLVAEWLERRVGSSDMSSMSGLAATFPTLAFTTLFFVVSSIAVPGLNNFIGEFLILFGLFSTSPLLTALVSLCLLFSVLYSLQWIEQTYFRKLWGNGEAVRDMTAWEGLVILPLLVMTVWIGIYPAPFLELASSASQSIFIEIR